MIGTDNRSLQEAPDILDRVRMNIATNPFLSAVIDRLMSGVFIPNTVISWPFIRVNSFGIRCGIGMYEIMKCLSVSVLNRLKDYIALSCVFR